ncbi:MAG: hypothetical protein H7122_16990 [Chitinophagaceae bacterium]|nr:hypothetical protein [Chitinophagaceae bacterium]
MLHYKTINEKLHFTLYPYEDETSVLKRITFFDSADTENDPILFNDFTWSSAKEKIQKAFDDYTNDLIKYES